MTEVPRGQTGSGGAMRLLNTTLGFRYINVMVLRRFYF